MGVWEEDVKRGGVALPGRLGRDQYDLNLCALSASRVLSNFVISRKLIRIDSRRPRFSLDRQKTSPSN